MTRDFLARVGHRAELSLAHITPKDLCGYRDVANMRWSSIDLAGKVVTFTPSKTKKTVAIPLHADLERHLLKSPGIGKAFLFPSLAGKGTGGKTGLSGQFAAIMARAGIAGKITRHSPAGRANSNLSFHSLRHSFNSAMANAGVSQEIRQKLPGGDQSPR